MKYVCPVCGYVHEGPEPPAECPICHVPGSKFTVVKEELTWAAEHVVGVSKAIPETVPEEDRKTIIAGLQADFNGECSEVGMYLAMSRAAFREGYPEIGLFFEKVAMEEAEHAAKYCEMLGDIVSESSKKNLQARVDADKVHVLAAADFTRVARRTDNGAALRALHVKLDQAVGNEDAHAFMHFLRDLLPGQ